MIALKMTTHLSQHNWFRTSFSHWFKVVFLPYTKFPYILEYILGLLFYSIGAAAYGFKCKVVEYVFISSRTGTQLLFLSRDFLVILACLFSYINFIINLFSSRKWKQHFYRHHVQLTYWYGWLKIHDDVESNSLFLESGVAIVTCLSNRM